MIVSFTLRKLFRNVRLSSNFYMSVSLKLCHYNCDGEMLFSILRLIGTIIIMINIISISKNKKYCHLIGRFKTLELTH